MALRVRRSDDTFTQTLKDGGDGAFSRGEWETRLEGPNPDVGVLKHTPAARILAKAGRLAPVYVVAVRRRVADVTEGDSHIEIAFDEGVAKARGEEAPFAELELELKRGPQWGLFALARRLADRRRLHAVVHHQGRARPCAGPPAALVRPEVRAAAAGARDGRRPGLPARSRWPA